MSKKNILFGQRIYIRPLVLSDASNRYLNWLKDPEVRRFIITANSVKGISDLEEYIDDKLIRQDVLLFGIFDKYNGLHIGNIKYEPIQTNNASAIVGVMIGDARYRGVGIFNEAFQLSSSYIKKTYEVTNFYLSVDRNNLAALKAYDKAGFSVVLDSSIPIPKDSLLMRKVCE